MTDELKLDESVGLDGNTTDVNKIVEKIGSEIQQKADKFSIVFQDSKTGEVSPFPIVISNKELILSNYKLILFRKENLKSDSTNKMVLWHFYYLLDSKGNSVFDKKISFKKAPKVMKNGDSILTDFINFGNTVGYSKDYVVSSDELVHFLICGGSGSGKSVFARNVAKQYLEHKAKILLIEKENDYNGLYNEYKDQFIYYGKIDDVSSSLFKGLNLLLLFFSIFQNQKNIIRGLGASDYKSAYMKNPNVERIVLLLDEYESFKQSIEKHFGKDDGFQSTMDKLIKVARSYGMTILISTQNYTVDAIGPTAFRNNLIYKFIGKLQNVSNLTDFNLPSETANSIKENTTYTFYTPNGNKFIKPPFLPNTGGEVEKKSIIEQILKYFNESKGKVGASDVYFLDNAKEFIEYFNISEDKLNEKMDDYFMMLYLLGKLYKEFKYVEEGGDPTTLLQDIVKSSWGEEKMFDNTFEDLFFPILMNKNLKYNRILIFAIQTANKYISQMKKYQDEGKQEEFNKTFDMMIETTKKAIKGAVEKLA